MDCFSSKVGQLVEVGELALPGIVPCSLTPMTKDHDALKNELLDLRERASRPALRGTAWPQHRTRKAVVVVDFALPVLWLVPVSAQAAFSCTASALPGALPVLRRFSNRLLFERPGP